MYSICSTSTAKTCAGEPLVERKAKLHKLVRCERRGFPPLYSEHFAAAGQADAGACLPDGPRRRGVEARRRPYRSGRRLAWIKSKCTLRQEFVIVGYVPSTAAGRGLRSLVLGLS